MASTLQWLVITFSQKNAAAKPPRCRLVKSRDCSTRTGEAKSKQEKAVISQSATTGTWQQYAGNSISCSLISCATLTTQCFKCLLLQFMRSVLVTLPLLRRLSLFE